MPLTEQKIQEVISLGLGDRQPENGFEIHFVNVCRGKARACSVIEKKWFAAWEDFREKQTPEIERKAEDKEAKPKEVVISKVPFA